MGGIDPPMKLIKVFAIRWRDAVMHQGFVRAIDALRPAGVRRRDTVGPLINQRAINHEPSREDATMARRDGERPSTSPARLRSAPTRRNRAYRLTPRPTPRDNVTVDSAFTDSEARPNDRPIA